MARKHEAGPRGRGWLVRLSVGVLVAVGTSLVGGPATALAIEPVSFATAAGFAGGGVRPLSIAIGDLNADGKPDLVLANSGSNNVSVLLGDGTGGFGTAATYGAGAGASFVAIGDLNADGTPDIVTANYSSDTVSVLLGDGSGGFSAPTNFAVGSGPLAVAIGDLNADGKPDLVTTGFLANTVSVLLGDGSGGFGPAASFAVGKGPDSVAIGDVNGDGAPDLAVANYDADTISILLNNGSGAFGAPTSTNVGSGPTSVLLSDLNGDGKLDFAESNDLANNICVVFGDGAGGFNAAGGAAYPVGTSPYCILVGDLNGDGKPDLATANYGSNDVSVLLGDGTGAYGTATAFPSGSGSASIAIGDLDADTRHDLATANYGSDSVAVLLNTTPPGTPAVAIDAGAAFTTTTTVTLSFTPTGTPADVMLANEPAFTGSVWQSYTDTATWTLDSSDGTKTVYARYRNGAGDVSGVCSDTIVLDSTPPVAVDDAATTPQDATLTVNAPGVLGNDIHPLFPVSAAVEVPPLNGKLKLAADGAYEYVPTPRFHGTDAFTYRASDGRLTSKPATVTITVVRTAILPGPVTGLVATPGDARVVLSWSNPTSDFAATRILRSPVGYATTATPVAGQTQVYEGAGTSVTDPGLTNGTTYHYTAFARNTAGNWSTRTTASATPAASLTKAILSQPRLRLATPVGGRFFVVSGTVTRHTGPAVVRVYFYRRIGSAWVWRYYRMRTVRTAAGSSNYRFSFRLPAGRWYAKAYHRCATHLASWSRLRYFRVR